MAHYCFWPYVIALTPLVLACLQLSQRAAQLVRLPTFRLSGPNPESDRGGLGNSAKGSRFSLHKGTVRRARARIESATADVVGRRWYYDTRASRARELGFVPCAGSVRTTFLGVGNAGTHRCIVASGVSLFAFHTKDQPGSLHAV